MQHNFIAVFDSLNVRVYVHSSEVKWTILRD